MNPFDQIKTLQAKLDAASETIEDLRSIIKDLNCGSHDELNLLIVHYGVKPAEAKLLLLLAKAKGQTKSKQWLVTNSRGTPCEKTDIYEPHTKVIDVHVCRLRANGLPIKTNWGMGYYIEPQHCEPILKIAKGQTDEQI